MIQNPFHRHTLVTHPYRSVLDGCTFFYVDKELGSKPNGDISLADFNEFTEHELIQMSKRRPPHLVKEITRHGKLVWHVRIGTGAIVRLRTNYGTQEFVKKYKQAVSLLGTGRVVERRLLKPQKGSLKQLIYNYYGRANWNNLAEPTKRQCEIIFEKLMAKSGDIPYLAISKKHSKADFTHKTRPKNS